MRTLSVLQRADRDGPLVTVAGRQGLARDVVHHLLVDAGWSSCDTCEPVESTHGVVAVLVDPERLHWRAARALGASVVVVVDEADVPAALDLVVLGADSIVTTNAEPAKLIEAVEVVAAGGSVLPPEITRALLHHLRSGSLRRRRVRGNGSDELHRHAATSIQSAARQSALNAAVLTAKADLLLRRIELASTVDQARQRRDSLIDRRRELQAALAATRTDRDRLLAGAVRRAAIALVDSAN